MLLGESYQEKLSALKDSPSLPKHVAIIMDGNGRWAKERGKPRIWGHHHGVKSVRSTIEVAGELGIEVLSLFAFSDENWRRPKYEVKALFTLLDKYLLREREALDEAGVVLQVIGDRSRLPEKSQKLILETEQTLSKNIGLRLNIALSYGGKSEIVRASQNLGQLIAAGKLQPEEINEDLFSRQLFTKNLPDPDLLIRTSGEQRVSNFLLWQIAYAEFYFTELFWPDFDKIEFLKAIEDFGRRKRRYGHCADDRPLTFLEIEELENRVNN